MSLDSIPAAHKQKIFFYLAIALSSLCLLIPAFWNHYPLLNPDTATYIESGFIPEMPSDRPITYGLLIRLFSLNGWSLWLLVFAQACIVSWLIFRVIRNLSGDKPYILQSLLILFILSIGSSLSWIVSQVQPDVFTSIALLCIVLLLMRKENKQTNILLFILFFFAVAVHLSHPALMIGILIAVFVLRRITNAVMPPKKLFILFALSAIALMTMVTPLSKSKHIFFMGSLLEKGVLKKYLYENCSSKNYKLCAYKDSLPKKADDFWWDPESPLNKIGDWKQVKPEFNGIIHDIFTRPAYIKQYAMATVKQTANQLITVNVGDGNQSFPSGSYVNRTLVKYFPNESQNFNGATQNKVPVLDAVALPNKIFIIIILYCLPGLLYMFFKWRKLKNEMKLLLVVCVTGILLNSLDCAAFGTINGRYGCKMVWLIPFCVLAFVTSKIANKEKAAPI